MPQEAACFDSSSSELCVYYLFAPPKQKKICGDVPRHIKYSYLLLMGRLVSDLGVKKRGVVKKTKT